MSCSDKLVRKIYGSRLKVKDHYKYFHHLFTLYEDPRTSEQYFLRTIELPAFLHISEGISDQIAKKYQHLLAPTKIIPIEKTFQTSTYLMRAPYNIILLTNFLEVIRDCSELIEIDFFKRFLVFLLNSYKVIDTNALPLYSINQIGILDSNEFTLCDPSLYFRNDSANIQNPSFGVWMEGILKQFFNLPLNREEYQMTIQQKFESHFNKIWPLIKYLLSGKATLQKTQSLLQPLLNRNSQERTTVTSSFMDVNEIYERASKMSMVKSKLPLKKIGKAGKMVIVFIILAVIVGVAYFVINFFNRKIICEEGFYLSLNQCIGCSEGCLRCGDAEPNRCSKCSVNMYLILDQEQDKQGYCLKECTGKPISMDVCVRQNRSVEGLQKQQPISPSVASYPGLIREVIVSEN